MIAATAIRTGTEACIVNADPIASSGGRAIRAEGDDGPINLKNGGQVIGSGVAIGGGERNDVVANAGRDRVRSWRDWTFDDHFEALVPTGQARVGRGNDLASQVGGNGGDNLLQGCAGG